MAWQRVLPEGYNFDGFAILWPGLFQAVKTDSQKKTEGGGVTPTPPKGGNPPLGLFSAWARKRQVLARKAWIQHGVAKGSA